MKAIYGLYADGQSAQQAVNRVRTAGFSDREITVISAQPMEDYEFGQRDKATWMWWIACGGGLVGMFGACFGLLLSYWLNLPTGPCITLLLGVVFGFAYLFSPRYGLIPRLWRRKRHFHAESLERWHEHPPA